MSGSCRGLGLAADYCSLLLLFLDPSLLCHSLRELDLSGNSLSSLPDDLGAFPSLALLRLNRNRLSGGVLVPLGRLPSLRELSMSGNVVTAAYEDVAGAMACLNWQWPTFCPCRRSSCPKPCNVSLVVRGFHTCHSTQGTPLDGCGPHNDTVGARGCGAI